MTTAAKAPSAVALAEKAVQDAIKACRDAEDQLRYLKASIGDAGKALAAARIEADAGEPKCAVSVSRNGRVISTEEWVIVRRSPKQITARPIGLAAESEVAFRVSRYDKQWRQFPSVEASWDTSRTLTLPGEQA